MQSPAYTPVGLATATPSPLHRNLVALFAGMLVLLTIAQWRVASEPGPQLPMFVGTYQTTVMICDLLTALMLFSQFIQFRTANLLVLSAGYFVTAGIVVLHTASFPGVFSAEGLSAGNADTAPWLWTAWHLAFLVSVLLYAVVRRPAESGVARAVAAALAISAVAILAAYALSTRCTDLFPHMISERRFTPFFLDVIFPLMMLLCAAAFAALLMVPAQYPIVTLYLMLAVIAYFLEVVNNWHATARYALGWYVGRGCSFVASVSLCAVFVVENALLLRDANRTAKALKDAQTEAERANDAKSHFLAAASHDLRQPLSALSLYVDTLQPQPGCIGKPQLTSMKECVANLNELLADLLDLSKLDARAIKPNVSDFSLDALLQRIMSSHGPDAKSKGLALRCAYGRIIGRTDPVLFQRIVDNLVSNAIRYTDRGGVLVGCRRRDGRLWVEVWDTGIGIPDGKTAEIFEEFKQLGNAACGRAKGSGLGLAIVARMATLLGLQIRVHSRPGKGSVFAVELPRGEAVKPSLQSGYVHRSLRVALVEDHAEVAAALAHALTNAGHQVVAAACCSDLLRRLDGAPPDIVISDYRLAADENGCDVVASLRSVFGEKLPAIIITGDTDPAVISRMAEKGVAVHHKPVHLETLRARIAELTTRVSTA